MSINNLLYVYNIFDEFKEGCVSLSIFAKFQIIFMYSSEILNTYLV